MNDGSAPWIKIITRIFEDPKIIAIEQLPEAYGVLILWFKLLTLAGEQNRGGAIYFTETVPFTAELLAAKWRCKPALVQMAFEVFQKFGMIGIDREGTIFVLNWGKYQNEEGLARIRDRSLVQLEDRSAEKSSQKRELAAARQRKHRQNQKQHGSNGAVTRDRGVTGVTECVTVTPPSDEAQRETVTQQNKTKNKNIPSTVPQRRTDEGSLQHSEAKHWLNTLFGRKRAWSSEEDSLLAGLLPVSPEDKELVQWGYSLSRDSEGWALIDGKRMTKQKQSLVALLRDFSSEVDKWRAVKNGNANGGGESEESEVRVAPIDGGWTTERRQAAYEEFGDQVTFATPFEQISGEYQYRIDMRAIKNARQEEGSQ